MGGLIAFIYVMFLESYFRESIAPKKYFNQPAATMHQNRLTQSLTNLGIYLLLKRFIIATAIPFGLLLVGLVIVQFAIK